MSGSWTGLANVVYGEPIAQPVQSFPVLRIGFSLCSIVLWRISHRNGKTSLLFSKALYSNSCSSPLFKVFTGYPLTGYPRVFSCQGTGANAQRTKKGHDNSVVSCLSCPNSMVLVLTSKAGGCRLFSGLLYWKNPACPAAELCTKRNKEKYEVVITNHFRNFVCLLRV